MWACLDFGKELAVGDLVCLIPELLGVILISLYLFLKDAKWVRRCVPWAFLLVSVANVLIPSWIMIYVYAVFKKDEVHMDMNITGDPEMHHDRRFKTPLSHLKGGWFDAGHYVESADAYVLWHSCFCYVEAAITFLLFCVYMGFEERKNADCPDEESSDDDTDY